jgi:hypothetical protein
LKESIRLYRDFLDLEKQRYYWYFIYSNLKTVTLENTELKAFKELLRHDLVAKLKVLAFLHFFIFGQPVNTFFLFLG